MKRALLCLIVSLCASSFADADQAIRSLQQTLKEQGFYYGAATGEKSAETSAAIRRYQIRNGLQVSGELTAETLRSVESNSKSVATAATRPTPNPAVAEPNNIRPDANARLGQSSAPPSQPASKPATIQSNNLRPDASAYLSQSSPPPSFQPDRPVETNPPYSASFYQSRPFRMNRRTIAGAQYQLMSRGYYRGRVDGRNGSRTAFAVRAFQFSAGLPPTGRLDIETVKALGLSGTEFADSAPASRGYETWMPVSKFKHGKWKVKWKRYYRPFGGDDGNEDRQMNGQSGRDTYNEDY